MPFKDSPQPTKGERSYLGRRAALIARRNPETIVNLARKYSTRAVQILSEIMEDKAAPPAVRVKAAETIIERAYGKAAQSITLEDKTESGLTIHSLSIAERILRMKEAQEQKVGETVDLENSQLRLVEATPVTTEPVEDLVG